MELKTFAGVELTELTQKALKWYCERTGEDPKEVLTEAIKGFLDREKTKEQYETVKVQVHKQLLKLIEEAKYFGRTPEKFFADCITAGTDVSVNDLDFDEKQRLEKKYRTEKLHLLEVFPDKASL
jgi:hypothetical protein